MSDPKQCGKACQFIKPDYPAMETAVHGRARDPVRSDEMYFGPFRRMLRAKLKNPSPGAQWTGITTRIAQRLLETQAVDAVLTMAPDPQDRWKPMPVLVTEPKGMEQVRGMRMGYAPLLALLEPAIAKGYNSPLRRAHSMLLWSVALPLHAPENFGPTWQFSPHHTVIIILSSH